MSLLDDLKKQAQEKNTKEPEDNLAVQTAERNWHILAPKQHTIFKYFKELADSLNVINQQDRANYSLTKSVVFKNLLKQDFRVSKGDKESLKAFAFRYDLVSDHDIKITLNNMLQADKMRSVLSERGFRFVDNVENQNRIIFRVKPKVTVSFEYIADLENNCILLKIDNFDGAWSQMIRYSPQAINDQLIEETAKYILGKPNRFQELSGNRVSEEMRAKLREKLQKDGKIPREKPVKQLPVDKLETTTIRLKNLFKK